MAFNVRKAMTIDAPIAAQVEGPYANGNPPAPDGSGVYPSHAQAEQVVSIVGIKNAQAGVLRWPDQAHGRAVTALRLALITSIMACARAEHPDPVRTMTDPPNQAGPAGSDVMTQTQPPMTCDAAKRAIELRRFAGWRGLPGGCTPDAIFGIKLDDTWGMQPLGSSFEKARTHLIELAGYGRALAYVRDGALVLFDAMSPSLDGGWPGLSGDLGAPEATFDWIFGTVAMPAGEIVYAKRGLTIFLNPENQAVAYIAVYVPTTVDEYARSLRPPREKRPH